MKEILKLVLVIAAFGALSERRAGPGALARGAR
jgi:hypothetical protein